MTVHLLIALQSECNCTSHLLQLLTLHCFLLCAGASAARFTRALKSSRFNFNLDLALANLTLNTSNPALRSAGVRRRRSSRLSPANSVVLSIGSLCFKPLFEQSR
jgi:hypothetical protein